LIKETTTAALGHSASDGSSGFKPDGKIAGSCYFNVDFDTFMKCKSSRKKGLHWNSFLGKSELTTNIKKWSRKNKNPDILFRHGNSYMWAQKG